MRCTILNRNRIFFSFSLFYDSKCVLNWWKFNMTFLKHPWRFDLPFNNIFFKSCHSFCLHYYFNVWCSVTLYNNPVSSVFKISSSVNCAHKLYQTLACHLLTTLYWTEKLKRCIKLAEQLKLVMFREKCGLFGKYRPICGYPPRTLQLN